MASRHIPARIVSLVCLFAVLLLTVSYAACMPPAPASVDAAHCSMCCPSQALATAPTACCIQHPATLSPEPQTLQLTLAPALIATTIEPATFRILRPANRKAPPPLLHPILRI